MADERSRKYRSMETRQKPPGAAEIGSNGKKVTTLHSQMTFKALLCHERSRSDRDGSEFSLAVFDVSKVITNNERLQEIVNELKRQMRSIDEMGWLDEVNVGVLLPVTSLDGGRKFSTRVLESIPVPPTIVPWSVYTYPSHWPSGGNGDSPLEHRNRGRPVRSSRSKPGENGSSGADILGGIFSLRVPPWKRWMDIVGASLLIALLSPLFLLVSAYIKAISPGKILFRQERVGLQGRLFPVLKFRTMHENNDPGAHRDYLKKLIRGGMPMDKLDIEDDPRIIPGGRILRKACLDELPQLINVLRGEMSLVGPRPCIPYEAEAFLRWHTHRFDILPGMTGLWQVSGKNKLNFEQMVRLDIAYAQRMSLLFDLKILLLTLPTIIELVFEAGVRRISRKPIAESQVDCSQTGVKGSLHDA